MIMNKWLSYSVYKCKSKSLNSFRFELEKSIKISIPLQFEKNKCYCHSSEKNKKKVKKKMVHSRSIENSVYNQSVSHVIVCYESLKLVLIKLNPWIKSDQLESCMKVRVHFSRWRCINGRKALYVQLSNRNQVPRQQPHLSFRWAVIVCVSHFVTNNSS